MKKRQKKKAISKCVNLNKPISISIMLEGKEIAKSIRPYLIHNLPIDDKLGENQQ